MAEDTNAPLHGVAEEYCDLLSISVVQIYLKLCKDEVHIELIHLTLYITLWLFHWQISHMRVCQFKMEELNEKLCLKSIHLL